jgi:hypothetical protein
MKKYFFLSLSILVFSICCDGQDTSLQQNTSTQKINIQKRNDNDFHKSNDSIKENSLDTNSKNLNEFFQQQKESESKEQRRMYIRIALGLLGLTALIFGLKRKRSK